MFSPTNRHLQAQIQATDELMVDQEFVVGPVTAWLPNFIYWANSTGYRYARACLWLYVVCWHGSVYVCVDCVRWFNRMCYYMIRTGMHAFVWP